MAFLFFLLEVDKPLALELSEAMVEVIVLVKLKEFFFVLVSCKLSLHA